MRPLSFMRYRSNQDWKGSPNGALVLSFAKGDKVESEVLGDELTAVALKEGWIEEDRLIKNVQHYIDAGFADEKSVCSNIKRAISKLDVNDSDLWTSKNVPTTEAIESVLGVPVSASERNEAWKQMQAE